MNTLPFIAAEVALGWLAEFLLDEASTFLGGDLLGFATVALMAGMIPLMILAIQDDLAILKDRRK